MSATRVYLGRLSNKAREREVERFFKGYGKIREIVLKEGYGFIEFDEPRDADDAVYDLNGKELCGDRVIVEHAKPPGARRDEGRMSGGRAGYGDGGGRNDYGRRGYGNGVGYAGPSGGGRYGSNRSPPERSRPPLRTDYRVLVENLSSKVSWQDLKDYMRKAGEVTYADAHKIRQNEGVVEFATRSDMQTALSKLDGTELNGRKIKLTEDKQNSSGRNQRRSPLSDRSKSRSRSPTRSRSHGGRASRSRSHSRSPSADRS